MTLHKSAVVCAKNAFREVRIVLDEDSLPRLNLSFYIGRKWSSRIAQQVWDSVWVNCYHLVSRGRNSKLLFKSGKRRAEALITSVGFGVT